MRAREIPNICKCSHCKSDSKLESRVYLTSQDMLMTTFYYRCSKCHNVTINNNTSYLFQRIYGELKSGFSPKSELLC